MSPLIPILGITFVLAIGLTITCLYLIREVRELRMDRDGWQRAYYAEREAFRQQFAGQYAEIDWFAEIESYANGSGEAS